MCWPSEVQGTLSPSAVESKGQGLLSSFHDPVSSFPDGSGGGGGGGDHLCTCPTPRHTRGEISFSMLMPLEPAYPHPGYQGQLYCAPWARQKACTQVLWLMRDRSALQSAVAAIER